MTPPPLRRFSKHPRGVDRGQLVIPILLISIVAIIFLSSLSKISMDDARYSVRFDLTTKMDEVAAASVEKSLFFIQGSTFALNTLLGGGSLPGYRNDTAWTDIDPAFRYAINIASFSTNCVRIHSVVQAAGRLNTFRGVEAVYCSNPLDAVTLLTDFGPTGVYPRVEWGAIRAFDSLTANGPFLDSFPRKFSRGGIAGFNGGAPAIRNTDDKEFWAYQTNMGQPPKIDLDYYRKVSQSGTTVLPHNCFKTDPLGPDAASTGNYFQITVSDFYLMDNCSVDFGNEVLFVSNAGGGLLTTTFKPNSFLKAQAIVLAGNNHNLSIEGFRSRVENNVTIPSEYQQEYLNAPLHISPPPANPAIVHNVAVRAFLYVNNTLLTDNGGFMSFVGPVLVNRWDNSNPNLTIYRDAVLPSQVIFNSRSLTRVLWKTHRPSAFPL